MTGKIAAAAVAAFVLAAAGAASAQTNTHPVRNYANGQAQFAAPTPFYSSYYNKDYWDAIASRVPAAQRDPFVGTVWENVAPY